MDQFGAMLTSFADLANLLLPVVYWVALLVGVVYAGLACLKIKDMGKDEGRSQATWGGVMGNLFVTLICAGLAGWASELGSNYGAIGSGLTSQMAYMQQNTASSLQPMWTAIKAWMGLMGVVAIFRAALLLNRAAQGQNRDGDHFWGMLWHAVGGAILINIATGLMG